MKKIFLLFVVLFSVHYVLTQVVQFKFAKVIESVVPRDPEPVSLIQNNGVMDMDRSTDEKTKGKKPNRKHRKNKKIETGDFPEAIPLSSCDFITEYLGVTSLEDTSIILSSVLFPFHAGQNPVKGNEMDNSIEKKRKKGSGGPFITRFIFR